MGSILIAPQPHLVGWHWRIGGSPVAVSYTHLDVYKRQNVGFIEWYELNDLPADQAEISHDPSLVDLSQASNLQEQAGRYVYQWTVRNLDQAELERCAERQELYVLADGSGWMICEHDGFIAQIEGDLAAQTRLLAHARTLPECGNLLTPIWRGSRQAQLITQLNWHNTCLLYTSRCV